VGKPAIAVVKASWVTLLAGDSQYRFSARNQLQGTVGGLVRGPVNCQVQVALAGGNTLSAIITNAAVAEMGLTGGASVVVLFKASHVLIGVPN
jgi:molybdate transport system regulatory protein